MGKDKIRSMIYQDEMYKRYKWKVPTRLKQRIIGVIRCFYFGCIQDMQNYHYGIHSLNCPVTYLDLLMTKTKWEKSEMYFNKMLEFENQTLKQVLKTIIIDEFVSQNKGVKKKIEQIIKHNEKSRKTI